MKLEEIQHITNLNWRPLTDEEVEFLYFLRFEEDNTEEIQLAQERMEELWNAIEPFKKDANTLIDELIYVAIGNAYSKADYLNLIARFGTPTDRDLDFDAVREYEALGEAVYRIGTLLAYGEGLGELEDVKDILEIVERPPAHDADFTIPASIDLIIRIPDYRRTMVPGEVRIEDINDVYWPPMFNAARHHVWEQSNGTWRADAAHDTPNGEGMRQIKMTVSTQDENQDAWLTDAELRYFSSALAHEAINEQVRDMRVSFYNGEIEVLNSMGGIDPPIWQMVWIALAQAEGKYIPGLCRSCGKLIDRRSERRNKTVSCNDTGRKCTAAFNNNGKKRMLKRKEWGRPFKPDSLFAYIEDYRQDVLSELEDQKANPNWPPNHNQSH